jgi:hypothetical protein
LECWFLKQRKSALKLQNLSGMWLSKAMKKQGFFHHSITPTLRKAMDNAKELKPPLGVNQSQVLWAWILYIS